MQRFSQISNIETTIEKKQTLLGLIADDLIMQHALFENMTKQINNTTDAILEMHYASSGEKAIQIIEEQFNIGRPFHFYILDQNMGETKGFDVIKKIRELEKQYNTEHKTHYRSFIFLNSSNFCKQDDLRDLKSPRKFPEGKLPDGVDLEQEIDLVLPKGKALTAKNKIIEHFNIEIVKQSKPSSLFKSAPDTSFSTEENKNITNVSPPVVSIILN
jgi:CheY-like chemotaxis protein